jgi:hypothetical protein
MSDIPNFAAISNELSKSPPAGTHAACPHCGELKLIEYGDKVLPNGEKVPSRILGYVQCGESSYLVAVEGKLLNPMRWRRKA